MSVVMPGQKIEASALAIIWDVPWWALNRTMRFANSETSSGSCQALWAFRMVHWSVSTCIEDKGVSLFEQDQT